LTELECQMICELQKDLSIVPHPYAVVAERLKISEEQLLTGMNAMVGRGIIRKVGAVLRHRRVGFAANALCVWKVPLERVVEIGEMFASLTTVTHCYERETCPAWSYNLYTMIHATSRVVCEHQIEAMSLLSGISQFKIFYSTKELKKTSMRYFE